MTNTVSRLDCRFASRLAPDANAAACLRADSTVHCIADRLEFEGPAFAGRPTRRHPQEANR